MFTNNNNKKNSKGISPSSNLNLITSASDVIICCTFSSRRFGRIPFILGTLFSFLFFLPFSSRWGQQIHDILVKDYLVMDSLVTDILVIRRYQMYVTKTSITKVSFTKMSGSGCWGQQPEFLIYRMFCPGHPPG